jgi:hypothetical protein
MSTLVAIFIVAFTVAIISAVTAWALAPREDADDAT